MRAAAGVQGRVIGALILREARTRYGRAQLGYAWALAEPVVLVLTFVAVFKALGRPALYGNSLYLFFATGVLPYLAFRRVSSFVTHALEANRALLSFPVVRPLDTMIARALLEAATVVLVALLILGLPVAMFEAEPPARPVHMAGAFAVLMLLGFGSGVLNAAVIARFESWKAVEPMLSRPLFFISGIFFLPDNLPERVRAALGWNPVLHGVEWMRYGYYFNYRAAGLDAGYLIAWAVVLTLIGLAAARSIRPGLGAS